MENIFIVTSIESYSKEDFEKDQNLKNNIASGIKRPYKYSRALGWFPTFEEAEEEVVSNACDIWEYSYDYAIIEETPPGYYRSAPLSNTDSSQGTVIYWYKFNEETRRYEKLDKCPDALVGNKHCIYYGTLG